MILLKSSFRLLFIFVLLCAVSFPFGKNKVTYNRYDWKVLKTAHFNIYYNNDMKKVAEETAKISEEAVSRYSVLFDHNLGKTIPLIIYSSVGDFQQTHILSGFIGEGVGGFTEALRTRVVVPFTGSYADLRHVVQHEIVHAFQFDIVFGQFADNALARGFLRMPPLWLVEGLAEYGSLGKDRTMEMYVRDGIMTESFPGPTLLEDPYRLGPYAQFVYKGGQAFYNYIVEIYGTNALQDMLHAMRAGSTSDEIFSLSLKKNVEQIEEEWLLYLKKKYWVTIERYNPLSIRDKKYTEHFEDDSTFNMHPVLTPDGEFLYYLSNKKVYPRIMRKKIDEDKRAKIVVTASREEETEFLHLLENVISFSDDGRIMVFSSQSGPEDRINIYDTEKDRIIESINPGFIAIRYPRVSSDGREIVFSGVKEDKADLYILDIDTKHLKRLTDDRFIEKHPSFSKDATKILFSANRNERGDYYEKNTDIFIYNRLTDEISTVISSPFEENAPDFNEDDSKIVFSSDRDGVFNLHIYSFYTKESIQITRTYGAALEPRFSRTGNNITYTGFEESGHDVYMATVNYDNTNFVLGKYAETNSSSVSSDIYPSLKRIRDTASLGIQADTGKYSPKFQLDFIFFTLGFSSAQGGGADAIMLASDMMNDHQIQARIQLMIEEKEFNPNGVINYFFLPLRVDLGFSAYHFRNSWYDYISGSPALTNSYTRFWDRRWGFNTIASLPLNKFNRFDLYINPEFTSVEYVDDNYTNLNMQANIYLAELMFVHDSTLWTYVSPIDNTRMLFTAQHAFKFSENSYDFTLFFADIRRYFMLTPKMNIATRLAAGKVFGEDKDERLFRMGGISRIYSGAYSDYITTVRGYEHGVFRGDSIALANIEFRFPFIEYLKIGLLPVVISDITGIIFADFGMTWKTTDGNGILEPPNPLEYKGRLEFDDLKSSFGFGLRFLIPPFFFCRLDWAIPWTGHSIPPSEEWAIPFFFVGMDIYDF